MTTSTLTVTYNQSDALVGEWFRLEQAPVTSNKLTNEDLQAMLALVQAGISARAYKSSSCEVSVLADTVSAELTLKVWPSSLTLGYSLTGDLVTIGSKRALEEWHEFDLVVPMTETVDLPYLHKDLSYVWQTPTYTRQGLEIDAPEISVYPTSLRLGAEVFGVLRIKCLSIGWTHVLNFSMPKTEASAITNLKPAVTLIWRENQTERLALELPGCLEALLAFCPDGNSKRSRSQSTVDNEGDDYVPVVYYSPCSGRMLTMRMEKP